MKFSKVKKLRAQGFDLSKYEGASRWLVACSQCEAACIDGIACHEHGCPNGRRAAQDGGRYDSSDPHGVQS